MLFQMSLAEVQHLNYGVNERGWRDTGLLSVSEPENMRGMFLRAALKSPGPYLFNLSQVQLRAIDMLLTDSDPRDGKLPDGSPVLDFVHRIWQALIGGDNADYNEDRLANEDNGAPSSGAEAVQIP